MTSKPRVAQTTSFSDVRGVEAFAVLPAGDLRAQKPRLAALIHVRLGHGRVSAFVSGSSSLDAHLASSASPETQAIPALSADYAESFTPSKRFCKPKVGGSIPSSGTKSPSAIVHSRPTPNRKHGAFWPLASTSVLRCLLKSHRASTNRAYANEAPTELAVRSAKAEGKITKLSDGGWLQLWVTGDGAKRWRLAYRYAGRQKVLAIAVYPPVGLKEARTARQDAKRLLSEGIDPSSAKKQAKAAQASSPANTFEAIGAELVDKKRREGKAANTIGKSEWLLSLALPAIGTRPIKGNRRTRRSCRAKESRIAREARNGEAAPRDNRPGVSICGRDRPG